MAAQELGIPGQRLKKLDVDSGRLPGQPGMTEAILRIALPMLFLLVWETLTRLEYINALFFPAPSRIFRTLYSMVISGELLHELGHSLRRVVYGFTLGVMPAIVVGLAMGWSRRFRAVVEPFIAAIYPIPKITLLPMVMLIFGIGDLSKIVLVAVASFFPVAMNATVAVLGISPTYFEVARNFGAGWWKTFTRVVLPGSLPVVFAGLRLAFGISLLLVVGVEFVSAQEGVGAMIWSSWQTLRTDRLYTGIVTWSIIGLCSNYILRSLERRIVRWSR